MHLLWRYVPDTLKKRPICSVRRVIARSVTDASFKARSDRNAGIAHEGFRQPQPHVNASPQPPDGTNRYRPAHILVALVLGGNVAMFVAGRSSFGAPDRLALNISSMRKGQCWRLLTGSILRGSVITAGDLGRRGVFHGSPSRGSAFPSRLWRAGVELYRWRHTSCTATRFRHVLSCVDHPKFIAVREWVGSSQPSVAHLVPSLSRGSIRSIVTIAAVNRWRRG